MDSYDAQRDIEAEGQRAVDMRHFVMMDEHQRRTVATSYMRTIPLDTLWSHTNGNVYTTLLHANMDSEDWSRYPPTIVYKGENGKVWTRPARDWHRSMTLYRRTEDAIRQAERRNSRAK
jgi:hypothetical protein